jgi:hypothetical protein
VPKFVSLSGRKFGNWLVSEKWERRTFPRGGTVVYWWCSCSCPLGISRWVASSSLVQGISVSCGCYRFQQANKANTKHGQNRIGKRSREYRIWSNILSRCNNPNHEDYPEYGGRGITVCERWMEVPNEKLGMQFRGGHWRIAVHSKVVWRMKLLSVRGQIVDLILIETPCVRLFGHTLDSRTKSLFSDLFLLDRR